MPTRCAWVPEDELYIRYHDEEWGKPVYDSDRLFELLILEGMQAGLSWITVLRKRENFRQAFDGFDARKMADYGDAKVNELMANPGIIRNRLKITGAIKNARQFLCLEESAGGFSRFVWQFVGGVPKRNRWVNLAELPAKTTESDALSRELQRLGFKFVGSTICYAFMQAAGLVNDHTTDCFRYVEV